MITPLTEKQIIGVIDKAIKDYQGNTDQLKAAIGYMMMTRKLGWKVTLLMHDKRTVAKYDKILDIDSRELFEDVGPWANKSIAWKAAQKFNSFWRAVRGDFPGVKSSELA